MFIYHSRLYEKYHKPILPIAIFTYNEKKEMPPVFSVDLPIFSIIEFHYQQLHLVNKSWKKYIKMTNPVGATFLSKMVYTVKECVQVNMEFLRMVSQMELDSAKMEKNYHKL